MPQLNNATNHATRHALLMTAAYRLPRRHGYGAAVVLAVGSCDGAAPSTLGSSEPRPQSPATPPHQRRGLNEYHMSSKSSKVVLVAIATVCLLFAAGLSAFIYYMVRPHGERVGAVSLGDASAALRVEGKPGDTLVFRVDASIGLPKLTLQDDEQVERRASQQLQRSLLTVRATAPSGKERSSTCAVYKGRAVSTTTTPGALSRTGMLNDCSLLLDEAGPWQVRGSVAWSSDLTLHSASLETRREAAAN